MAMDIPFTVEARRDTGVYNGKLRNWLLLASVVMLFGVPQNTVHACAVCFGAADSSQTAGMNMAMITLLGVTGTVFCGIGACIFTFRRRILAIEREAHCGAHREAEVSGVDALGEVEPFPSDESLRENAIKE